MSKRAAAAERTRRRIVDATRQLHTEQGIAATSWDDIARRAGVGVGTVYRHFPTLDDLVPACGALSMAIVDLPADIPALFEGLSTPAERMDRLVREAFSIYERASGELHVVRREPDAHPSVTSAVEEIEASLSALVDAALSPYDVSRRDRALVRAMIDLDTWEAMRGAGLDSPGAAEAVSEMLAARLPTGR